MPTGGLVEVDLGYRITPQLSLGAYGTFSKFQGDHVSGNANVLGATACVQAIWHLRPDRSVDPWVSLGTGWKALWVNPVNSPSTSLQASSSRASRSAPTTASRGPWRSRR